MRKIYENPEFARVGHFQSVLEARGIATMIKNEAMASVFRGTAGLHDLSPELWVMNEADYERAMEILGSLQEEGRPAADPWTCPRCGEAQEGSFDECWNCQTERPGAA